ncbi:MAG: hypothetical protein NW218_09490 [Saprospiraceae bacterium]|nr:hypothetical protein [Saprospiraceae bacterium]
MAYSKIQFSKFLMLLIAVSATLVVGCKKDAATVEEKITKIEVHLTGINGSTFNEEFSAEDPDADGVFNTIASIDIPMNTVFNVHVHVYDGTMALDSEIEEESNDHLFVYQVTGGNLVVGDLNLDAAGKPFGQDSKWTSAAASTGSVRIKLIHEPTDKDNTMDPGGSVDFDVTFPVKVQ